MEGRRDSFVRSGGVMAIAFMLAGALSGFLLKAYPQGGFVRDLLAIVAIATVGSIISMAFRRPARPKYFAALSMVVGTLLMCVCTLKFCTQFRNAVAVACASVQVARMDKDGHEIAAEDEFSQELARYVLHY